MVNNHFYLSDFEFLRQLDQSQNKNVQIKVTALTWEELPIASIEGNATGGNVNIDGNSSLRRTCSLTMVAKDIDLQSFYQGLNTKIAIDIGIENVIDSKYPEIVWIPLGIYILTSFSSSVSINNYTISLQGKDKMCLLNGDVGGSLGASIDFGTEEIYDLKQEVTTYKDILLKDIIRNIVHVYGQEPFEKIFINDLDIYGYSLMKYRGGEESPMYYLISVKNGAVSNVTLDGTFRVTLEDGTSTPILNEQMITYEPGVESLLSLEATIVFVNGNEYTVRKVVNQDTAGYRYTDLTYAGELIAKPGESITSVLDKIVKMLGNYEYFYDVNGNFIFQRKKNNLYDNWNPIVESIGESKKEFYIDPLASPLNYMFYGSNSFTSISHNPDLMTIKNDYSIWGERTAASGVKVPVHLRYALHRKPTLYINYDKELYHSTEYDWRELIYQMAQDYLKHGQEEDFTIKIAENNPIEYPTGRTGYEMFYTDIVSFWRELYDPEKNEQTYKFWNKNVYEAPTTLNFWFDFLGENTPLDRYSIPAIGDRPKVVNDTDVGAIYFKDTPDVLLRYSNDEAEQQYDDGYTVISIPNYLQNLFSISERRKSAFEVLEEVLYDNTQAKETVSINAIPIYYLQPNTRIGISDNDSGVHGEFIISRLTLPLTHNGTMQLTATRALNTLY